jgi:pyrimidine 5'-nucleotidase
MSFNNFKTLLIDLDDTLYPFTTGIWDLIGERINSFLIDQLGFPSDDVPALRHRLWQQYGTTLRGLQVEFHVDMEAYLAYVHDIPLTDLLPPNPRLADCLSSLPQRKIIFTNADSAHACRVLNHLEVADQFADIIDVHAMFPHCKPQPEAFRVALKIINEAPSRCLLIDDSPVNLATAQAFGMGTISVGRHRHAGSPHLETLSEIVDLLG